MIRSVVISRRTVLVCFFLFTLPNRIDLIDDSNRYEMETSISTTQTTIVQSELVQRHKATARTVRALLIGVVLLCVLAFVSKKFLTEQSNPSLHMAVLITILVLGLGAIAFRRTRFATMRLQDIAGLRGASGLLITLQRTTLQIALIGATAALVGFIATLLTGDDSYTYRAGLVAVAVLLYCYPVRSSWERAVKRFSPAQNAPDS
jgi:anaerobic C4-dicarboxylate transporter